MRDVVVAVNAGISPMSEVNVTYLFQRKKQKMMIFVEKYLLRIQSYD